MYERARPAYYEATIHTRHQRCSDPHHTLSAGTGEGPAGGTPPPSGPAPPPPLVAAANKQDHHMCPSHLVGFPEPLTWRPLVCEESVEASKSQTEPFPPCGVCHTGRFSIKFSYLLLCWERLPTPGLTHSRTPKMGEATWGRLLAGAPFCLGPVSAHCRAGYG